MDCGGFSGAMLDWKCPNRARGSDIPLDVYQEIFAWLRPAADPDTDREVFNTTLARLALVCRYFAYYATHEMWRCPEFHGGNYHWQTSRMPAEAWCTGVETQLQPVKRLRTHVRECELRAWVQFISFDYAAANLMIGSETVGSSQVHNADHPHAVAARQPCSTHIGWCTHDSCGAAIYQETQNIGNIEHIPHF
ncbi:hypothetical protein JB92DRAFT_1334324 [Gautieria morchelliformis]|nr:hypothetical protein JB92DRAFT_1334324 [Gautieria morchelliformis]